MDDNQQEIIGYKMTTAGYVILYRQGHFNLCPGCSGGHWHIGRRTAECAFCATALPLAANATPASQNKAVRIGWRALLPAS